MIEKMQFVSITGPKADIDRVVDQYLSRYEIHLENALAQLQTLKTLTPYLHRIVERLLRDVAAYPRVHDARAVDAEQNAVTGIAGRVIDVDEGVHARLRVGLAFVRDAVYHAARAACCGDFARLHDVE